MPAYIGNVFVISELCCIASVLMSSNVEIHDAGTALKGNFKRQDDFIYGDEGYDLLDDGDSSTQGNLDSTNITIYDLNSIHFSMKYLQQVILAPGYVP